MRTLAYVTVALLVVLAGCGAGGTPTATSTGEPPASTPTATPAGSTPTATPADTPTATPTDDQSLEDPASDVLGWEQGFWYNESLSVTKDDGLNQSELDKVVARSMARVERVRKLEFEKDIPVEIITREEFVNQSTGGGGASVKGRLHQNVKYEATFMVNESTDALAELRSNTAASVLGYYSPSNDKIVIISPSGANGSAKGLDEFTLAHELAHAVQDQNFDISNLFGDTTEEDNALSGLVEGDAHFTEYLYLEKCRNGKWDCLKQPDRDGGGGGGDIHVGLFIVSYTPYSEGQEFVKSVYDRKGWAGVNDLYENPPASTEQLIHPEKYPGEEPVDVTIQDTSSNGWHILDLEGPTDHAVFGEAGLYSMMWYTTYAAFQKDRTTKVVVSYSDLFEYKDGTRELQDIGAYDYGNEVTDGWAGDRLQPYVKGDASADSPTGYVWKIEWDTPEDARQFYDAYLMLLEHYGAQKVGENTWRIPKGNEFADAYYVSIEGTTVTIVNAPTVDDLGDVHRGAGS